MAAERFLSLRIADLPMVLLLAARPAEVGQLAVPLAEILADPATVSIRPGPLSAEGAARRVESLLGSGDPDFAAACHHATGGNPFLLEQLVSEIRAEGIEPTADERRARRLARARTRCGRRCCCGSSGCRARAARWRARSRCSASTRSTLKDVATLAACPEDAAADALAELERSGLVTGTPRLRFTHPDPARRDRGRHAGGGALTRARAGGAHARRPRGRPRGGGRPPAGVRPRPGRVGARDATPRRAACRGAGRPVGLGALPGARRDRAPRGRRARRDPLRARPRRRPRRATPTRPSTWSGPPRRAARPACGRSTGPRSSTSSRAARSRPPTCSRRRSPTCPRSRRRPSRWSRR